MLPIHRTLRTAAAVALLAAFSAAPSLAQGWFGVTLTIGETEKLIVDEVVQGGPAQKAGVKSGDQIVTWNGEKLGDFEDLRAFLTKSAEGDKATVGILRGDKKLALRVTLGDREKALGEAGFEEMEVEEITEEAQAAPPGVGRALRLSGDANPQEGLEIRRAAIPGGAYMGVRLEASEAGVVVSSVVEDSAAQRIGISDGEILREIDGKSIKSVEQVIELIRAKKAGDRVEVKTTRRSDSGNSEYTYVFNLGTAPSAQAPSAFGFVTEEPVEVEEMVVEGLEVEEVIEEVIEVEPEMGFGTGGGRFVIRGQSDAPMVIGGANQARLQKELAELKGQMAKMQSEMAEMKKLLRQIAEQTRRRN